MTFTWKQMKKITMNRLHIKLWESGWLMEIVVIHIRLAEHLSSQGKSKCLNESISHAAHTLLDVSSLYEGEFFVYLHLGFCLTFSVVFKMDNVFHSVR